MSKGQFNRPSGPGDTQDESIISLADRGRKYRPPEIEDVQEQEMVGGGGGGGGSMDDVIKRVSALEDGQKEMRSLLKEIRDGQQIAAVKAAETAGALSTKFAEVGTSFAGVDTKFADVTGKLNTMNENSNGLRRDLDKLPNKFDVATIMVFVVTGLGAAAGLLKIVWPALSKVFS